MDNRLLLFLETLESSDSFSEAAQKLYLSQPYISRVIKKYEQQYNVLLIRRDTHPLQLTPAGRLLINYLRRCQQLKNELSVKMRKYEKKNFLTLKMGITPPLGENFNLAVLPRLLTEFPYLSTETVELSTADAEKAFKDDQLDLFVGKPIHLPNVRSQFLYTDTQVLVLNQNSRLYQPGKHELTLDSQDLALLNQDNFILVDGERRYQEIINHYFTNLGLHFDSHIRVRDSATALKLAAQGLGNMTTSIEAVQSKPLPNINYIVLPREEININFSLAMNISKNYLIKELTYVSTLLEQNFRTLILT